MICPKQKKEGLNYWRHKKYRQDYRLRSLLLVNRLKHKPCADCQGWFEPVQMDFDHIKNNKKFDISRPSERSTKIMLEEIKKCELVCANCHRLRTAKRGQYRDYAHKS